MKDYKYICMNCGSLFKIRRHTGYSTTGCGMARVFWTNFM